VKKIECIVRTVSLEPLIGALEQLDIAGLNITQTMGYGHQKGASEAHVYRGVEYTVKLREKFKVELVVNDEQVEDVVNTIVSVTRTKQVGDGKIFIYPIEDAIRIRTGEKGNAAV